MTLVDPTRTKGLRHEGVETEQHPHPENADRDEQGAAQADGANRLGAKRPDHERVDHAHGDPSQLGDHHRGREREHRTELFAQIGEARRQTLVTF